MDAALGFVSRNSFLNHLNYYPMTRIADQHMNSEDRMLMIGDHRGYHFDSVNYLGNDFFDTPVIISYMHEQDGLKAFSSD